MSTTESPPQTWWTVTDLVKKSGLSRMTVIREITRGNLPASRQGARRPYLVDPADGAEWLQRTLAIQPVVAPNLTHGDTR